MMVRGLVDTSPARLRHWSVLAFGCWNAAIWLSRVRNILADQGLDTAGKALWMVPAMVFGLGGVAALWGWWKGPAGVARLLMAVLAATLLYWPIRVVFMLFDERSAAFRIVHLVLGVVSVGLALAITRRLVRTGRVPQGAFR
ncbi:MAG: hypothetical protein ACKV2O_01875 [Acidimicrobiales bacterium]